jgi:uncharacterized C2H2 Zn-finger protein
VACHTARCLGARSAALGPLDCRKSALCRSRVLGGARRGNSVCPCTRSTTFEKHRLEQPFGGCYRRLRRLQQGDDLDGAGASASKKKRKMIANSSKEIKNSCRIYECTTCGKAFKSNSELTRHLRVHSGDKPYSCDTCGIVFATSGALSRHLRVHSGDKPYSCDTCGKAFADSSNLTR